MRRLSFLFFILIFVLLGQSVVQAAQPKVLTSLQFTEKSDGKAIIAIKTQEEVSCTNFYIAGKAPRIIFDFAGTSHKFKNEVALSKTGLVSKARFGLHQNPLKTRMVIDLLAGFEKPKYTIKIESDQVYIEIFPVPGIELPPKNAPKKATTNTPRSETEKKPVVPAKILKNKTTALLGTQERKVAQPESAVASPPVMENKVVPQVAEPPQVVEGRDNTADSLMFDTFVPPVVESGEALLQNREQSKIGGGREALLGTTEPIFIKDIKHSMAAGKEDVLAFFLTDFNTPIVTAVEGDKATVSCKFTEVLLRPEVALEQFVDGYYVEKVKVESRPDVQSVNVVLELKNQFSYDLEQTYYKNANVFSLTIKGHKQ